MNHLHRIDVHHHVVPPFWSQAVADAGGDPVGVPPPSCLPPEKLDLMDSLGIRVALLSLTSPGLTLWRSDEQVRIAREVNVYVAEVVQAMPDRFGHLATLPMADADAAATEAAHALDVLKADGVVLLSSYDGQYLGEPRFDPVWEALDARAAVVLVHPTVPSFPPLPGIWPPMIDFPFDTTRAAISMLAEGTLRRWPRLRIILSHGGGFLPYAALRCAGGLALREPGRSEEDVIAEMRSFYFDTALSSASPTLECLTRFAAPGHVLFGSDIPYARDARIEAFTRALDAWAVDEPTRVSIDNGAALALFPRLKAA